MEKRNNSLDGLVRKQEKTSIAREKFYRFMERHPALTAAYVKMTELSYCLPRF